MSDYDNGKPPGQNVIYAPDTSVIPKENDPAANQPKTDERMNELEELAANGESLPEPEDPNQQQEEENDEFELDKDGNLVE
jgi:hypothetical protein